MNRIAQLAGAYLLCGVIFLGLDAVWLTLTAERLYRPVLGGLMADQVRLAPAVAFYLIYLAGVTGFCIAPALKSGRAWTALVRGAGFGFTAYATYDLTNQATLAAWATRITLLDLAWGTTATAVSAACAAALLLRLRRG